MRERFSESAVFAQDTTQSLFANHWQLWHGEELPERVSFRMKDSELVHSFCTGTDLMVVYSVIITVLDLLFGFYITQGLGRW